METSDREQIVDLIARLAQATDQGTVEEYVGCFTEDAVFAIPGAEPVKGRRAMLDAARARRATGALGPGSHTRHCVSTTTVQLANDTASATSYVVFYGAGTAGPVAKVILVYQDSFRRTPAGWRISERKASPA